MEVIQKNSGEKYLMPTFKNIGKYLPSNERIAPLFLLGIGVIFIVLGIYRGEVAIVFTKAIRICLECIGIG
jgi:hypothetical protein